jgi:hypothetical protein
MNSDKALIKDADVSVQNIQTGLLRLLSLDGARNPEASSDACYDVQVHIDILRGLVLQLRTRYLEREKRKPSAKKTTRKRA